MSASPAVSDVTGGGVGGWGGGVMFSARLEQEELALVQRLELGSGSERGEKRER